MEKYTYDTDNNEKLTEVRVVKVWLKEDLLPADSVYNEMYPGLWGCIQEEVDAISDGFHFELKDLNKLILSNPELFILFIYTESSTLAGGRRLGQRAFISNRNTFKDITGLMVLTNLIGCKFQIIHPPYEDFINDFVNEVYF